MIKTGAEAKLQTGMTIVFSLGFSDIEDEGVSGCFCACAVCGAVVWAVAHCGILVGQGLCTASG